MVVKASLEWRGSASFDDQVRIAVSPDRLGNKSFDLRQPQRLIRAIMPLAANKAKTTEDENRILGCD
jgi:acyl-CoA thioesterase FadM